MKKKLLVMLLMASVIVSPVLALDNNSDIKVIINGNNLSFEQPPVLDNGRVLVPVREIFEALGAEVNWISDTQEILATKGDKNIALSIGSNQMYINNETSIELDVPAKIVENKTLIPLRAVSEAFDATVEWNKDSKTATIMERDSASSLKIDKLSKVFEVKADDGTLLMTIKYNYPSIDNPDNNPYIKQFNDSYEQMSNEFIETNKLGELATEALSFYKSTLTEDFEFREYTLENSYDVKYNKNKIISILSTNSMYTGGAHPNYENSGAVYDLSSNKELALTDILNKTQEEIKQIFIESFSTTISKDTALYFEDAKTTVNENADKIKFYLSNDGLVFFFNPYEIAPYAAGTPEFAIPFDGNEPLFKLNLK